MTLHNLFLVSCPEAPKVSLIQAVISLGYCAKGRGKWGRGWVVMGENQVPGGKQDWWWVPSSIRQ